MPNFTAVAPVKLAPVIVTVVPPNVEPDVGEMLVMLGRAFNVIFTLKNLRFSRGCVGFVAVSPYFFEIV